MLTEIAKPTAQSIVVCTRCLLLSDFLLTLPTFTCHLAFYL